jgi:hypothetical protein
VRGRLRRAEPPRRHRYPGSASQISRTRAASVFALNGFTM